VREPPAGTSEAMTAEPPTTCAADVSRSHRPTEVRAAHAGTQMSATEVSTTHPAAEVSPAHAAAAMTTAAHAATAMTTATPTSTARQRGGRDAGTSHGYGCSDDRDFVQRKFPHDSFSFRSDDSTLAPMLSAPRRRAMSLIQAIDCPGKRLLNLVTAFSCLRCSSPPLTAIAAASR
jgi:hypothetical protein